MVEGKLRLYYVGDTGKYGFKVGDWINKEVFFMVDKKIMSDGEDRACYDSRAIFEDGKMVKIREKRYPFNYVEVE